MADFSRSYLLMSHIASSARRVIAEFHLTPRMRFVAIAIGAIAMGFAPEHSAESEVPPQDLRKSQRERRNTSQRTSPEHVFVRSSHQQRSASQI